MHVLHITGWNMVPPTVQIYDLIGYIIRPYNSDYELHVTLAGHPIFLSKRPLLINQKTGARIKLTCHNEDINPSNAESLINRYLNLKAFL